MFIIGELINATRKKVGAAVQIRDAEFIRDLAQRQAAAGADAIDVNGGVPGHEAESLEWLIGVVQEATELPLSIDSSDAEAVRLALPLCKQRAVVNSITDEPARLEALIPVLKEHRARVIALCMSAAGTPTRPHSRTMGVACSPPRAMIAKSGAAGRPAKPAYTGRAKMVPPRGLIG